MRFPFRHQTRKSARISSREPRGAERIGQRPSPCRRYTDNTALIQQGGKPAEDTSAAELPERRAEMKELRKRRQNFRYGFDNSFQSLGLEKKRERWHTSAKLVQF